MITKLREWRWRWYLKQHPRCDVPLPADPQTAYNLIWGAIAQHTMDAHRLREPVDGGWLKKMKADAEEVLRH